LVSGSTSTHPLFITAGLPPPPVVASTSGRHRRGCSSSLSTPTHSQSQHLLFTAATSAVFVNVVHCRSPSLWSPLLP
ncbi:hypothetical protein S83_060111, partial [Arachis hypogaea]